MPSAFTRAGPAVTAAGAALGAGANVRVCTSAGPPPAAAWDLALWARMVPAMVGL
jgi:hypothetical protein